MSFYDLLNVSEDSPLKDIKDSYRALSKKFHPDKNPNDKYSEEKMKLITEAYEIVSDYEKRRQYDLQLHPMDTFMFRPRFNFNYDSMFPTIDHLLQTNSDNISSSSVSISTVIENGVKKTRKVTTENGVRKIEEYEEPYHNRRLPKQTTLLDDSMGKN